MIQYEKCRECDCHDCEYCSEEQVEEICENCDPDTIPQECFKKWEYEQRIDSYGV